MAYPYWLNEDPPPPDPKSKKQPKQGRVTRADACEVVINREGTFVYGGIPVKSKKARSI